MEKLNAVVLFAEAGDMMAVRQLAENLDQFDFVPCLQTLEEVVYQGTVPLEKLMMEDPAEKHQREQGLQMGGLTQ